jgi:hypothetical protein
MRLAARPSATEVRTCARPTFERIARLRAARLSRAAARAGLTPEDGALAGNGAAVVVVALEVAAEGVAEVGTRVPVLGD